MQIKIDHICRWNLKQFLKHRKCSIKLFLSLFYHQKMLFLIIRVFYTEDLNNKYDLLIRFDLIPIYKYLFLDGWFYNIIRVDYIVCTFINSVTWRSIDFFNTAQLFLILLKYVNFWEIYSILYTNNIMCIYLIYPIPLLHGY